MSAPLNRIEARWNSVDESAELWIDGRCVIDMIMGPRRNRPDAVSPFALRHVKSAVENSLRCYRDPALKSDQELPAGVLELSVCPMCGHWQCGSFSVRLRRDGDVVEWSSPAWASAWMDEPEDPDDDHLGPDEALARFPQLLGFSAACYDAALDRIHAFVNERDWPDQPEPTSAVARLRRWFSKRRAQRERQTP